ncbi:MAG: DNA translocase FtsK 4TM domain-containing protein [Patescibacteria group bacterium]
MAKKSKSGKARASEPMMDQTTRRGVLSIIILALALITILSLFGLAGTIGVYFNTGLTTVVGLGRYIVPILLLIVVYHLLAPKDAELELSPLFITGMVIMAVGIFGLIDIVQPQAGGYVGTALTYLFRTMASVGVAVVIFVAFILISILIVFNASLLNIIQHIPARTMLGKTLRFVVAFFGSARQRLAIAKEEAMTEVEAVEEIHELPTDEPEPDYTENSVDALDEEIIDTEEGKQMKLVRIPKHHRKIDLPLDLLSSNKGKPTSGDIEHNKEIIVRTLQNFGIDVELGPVSVGPTVTQYSFRPASGVKVSQVVSLQNDLALALAAHPIRIEAPIPGKSLIGVEVPNIKAAQVGLRELLESDEFRQRKTNLTLVFGKDVSGKAFVGDLAAMPHMLIAGATGSGKSVCMNTVLISLLYQNGPDDLKIVLVDPKRVEFSMYNDIPHLLTPVITDVQKTINALQWTVNEMDRRYEVLAQAKKRDIAGYNTAHPEQTLPYIVFVIDELADLMATAPREVEAAIVRLAQMARAVGIHLVLATQRPSVDVITGLIKANITTRCAFSTASVVDSRTILDMSGAEKLLGRGDMLYMSTDSSKPRRLQGAFVSEEEISHVVTYLKDNGKPDYDTEVVERGKTGALPQAFMDSEADDELLPAAKKVIVDSQKASASLLQRRLRVGYARAARLLDILEEQGFIGPADGAKPREIMSVSTDTDIPTPEAVDEDDTTNV